MRKYILILMLALSHLFVLAHYSLHSVSGNVKIDSNGKQTPAAKGMTLKASDYLIIPEGGKVEIYNDLDKGIYASTKPGRISVTRLMIDARGVSADNRGNVASRLRFGRQSDPGKERLYVEKGMVKRSLGVYDPEGEKIVADPDVMARFIALKTAGQKDLSAETLPVPVEKSTPEGGGISFKVKNSMQFPIYFNILKITDNEGRKKAGISEVGQPAGVYVLLPGQTLAREHFTSVPSNESHILVMTHSQFDIDDIIERLDALFKKGEAAVGDTSSEKLPLYLLRL